MQNVAMEHRVHELLTVMDLAWAGTALEAVIISKPHRMRVPPA